MLTSTPRKLIAAALTALTLTAGLTVTASAHPVPHHHYHGHWGHGYWGGFFPIVVGGADYSDCYYVRERVVGRHGRIYFRRVRVCD
jgi:hypothetical protein